METSLTNKEYLKDKTEYTGVHPQKFALWLAMASMSMFFAALTSALLVKKGDYNYWEGFTLPGVFFFSTITVIATSISLHLALRAYRKASFARFRSFLVLGFVLAFMFLGLQLLGWKALMDGGMTLTYNLSGSFVYVLTAMHGLHLIGGLVALLIFIVFAWRSRFDPIFELRNIINPKRQLNLELLVSYWHFVDILWIYLYIFLYINY